MKPRKESVSLIIKDSKERFLIVKRADDPEDDLANVWGFPAASLREGETRQQLAQRVAKSKLGVKVEIGKEIGQSTHDRGSYILHLTDLEARIIYGTPSVPQADTSVSQYSDWKFTNDPRTLFEAAQKGSQCTQIFLESIGEKWES